MNRIEDVMFGVALAFVGLLSLAAMPLLAVA
jgi:hypothetical protein